MNNRVRKQDLEKLLFLDIETTRRNDVLDINSKEYDLYAWKLRDKETSKLPPANEVLEHYKLNGALDPAFNKIVCILHRIIPSFQIKVIPILICT